MSIFGGGESNSFPEHVNDLQPYVADVLLVVDGGAAAESTQTSERDSARHRSCVFLVFASHLDHILHPFFRTEIGRVRIESRIALPIERILKPTRMRPRFA